MHPQKGNSSILILLSLTIGLIIGAGVFWNRKTTVEQRNVVKQPTKQTVEINNTETPPENAQVVFPPLPEGFTWEEREITFEEADENTYRVYYDNRIEIPKPKPQDLYHGDIVVTGTEYTTKTTLQSREETYTSPYITHMETLENTGWVWRKDVYPFVLTGIMADGPFDSQVSGYLKGDNKTISTVIISKYMEGTVVNNFDDLPPSIECPCTYTVRIFQSDPIILEEQLP